MWRLMVVTFGILALVFFELSGGADYAPVENSLQRHGIGPHLAGRAVASAETDFQAQDSYRAAERTARVETTLAALTVAQSSDTTTHTQAEKTQALVQEAEIPELGPDADDAAVIAALKDAGAQMETEWPGAIELFERNAQARDDARSVSTPAKDVNALNSDLHHVRGDLANMRVGPGTEYEKIASLTEGTEVLVLFEAGNGWVELQVIESGQIGWMADWLIGAGPKPTGFAGAAASGGNIE